MKQKHNTLLPPGPPAQGKDGAKACPQGNTWKGQMQWASQGLGQAENGRGLMLGDINKLTIQMPLQKGRAKVGGRVSGPT